MSWDILPKSNLQYFLQKLKGKFDLKADKGEVEETDTPNSTPFLYRQTPYNADGVFLDELVGGSVAWNQLVQNGNFADTSGWQARNNSTISVNSGVCTVTPGSANSLNIVAVPSPVKYRVGHKILVNANIKSSASIRITMQNNGLRFSKYSSASGSWESVCGIYNSVENEETLCFTNTTNTNAYDIKNVYICDLTQMFGTTIADYVYTLEKAQAGSGIAWLKSYGFFTKDYYPYNAGELISVKTSGKKYVGFNQWDEEWELGDLDSQGNPTPSSTLIRSKNFISVVSSITYYFKSNVIGYFAQYDANKIIIGNKFDVTAGRTFTTASNARYIKFILGSAYGTTYNHDICINISKTEGTPKNGDYVPYEEKTYDISNIDLRGIPKLVNNELVYDGDTYESDGNVTRKYGIVDLGSLTYARYTDYNNPVFNASVSGKKESSINILSILYPNVGLITGTTAINNMPNKSIGSGNNTTAIFIRDDSYSSAESLKSAMSGVYLIYELATPTTEQLAPYQNPQICYKDGTEEWIDDRTVPIPVGHNSRYADLPAIMDGDYLGYMTKNFASEEYVDRALEEVDAELDTKVDKVSGKGLSTNDYTDAEKALVATIPDKADSVDVESTQTVAGNPIYISDAAPMRAESVTVDFLPKQDLHGYDYPWIGGAGKNKLPLDLSTIKSLNTYGTWSGNVYTIVGLTFTVNTDSSGNVSGITISGHGTDNVNFFVASNLILTSASILNLSSDKNTTNNDADFYVDGIGIGSSNWISGSANISAGTYQTIAIYLNTNYNDTITIHPMIRLATETDASFTQYSNICPISGYTGVEVLDRGINQWDEEWVIGKLIEDGSVDSDASRRTTGFIQVQAGKTYYQKSPQTAYWGRHAFYDENKNCIYFNVDGFAYYFTAPENAKYVRITFNIAYGTTYNHDISINYPSTFTEYVPYHSSNATIQFGQTVYGGRSNLTDGGTESELEIVDLGSLNWSYDATQSHPFFYTDDLSSIIKHIIGLPQPLVACERYRILDIPTNVTDSVWADASVHGSMIYHASSPNYVYVRDDRFTSVYVFKSAVNGVQLVYEKATPDTISTPPTEFKLLKGTNNITTNGTTITLGYQSDNVIGEIKSDFDNWVNENSDCKVAVGEVVEIEDVAGGYPEELIVDFEPQQDFHGYSYPWIGGAGKNKLPMTVDGLKAINTNGTWSDNTYTVGNATFTIETDTDGNVTGIKVNGGNSSNTSFFLVSGNLSAYGGMILNGTPNTVEGAYMCAELQDSPWTSYAADYGSGSEISNDIGAGTWIFIRIYAGSSVSNVMFYPMIRLSTETDPTFEPYTNICAWPFGAISQPPAPTQCWVTSVGKNKIPMTFSAVKAANTDGSWDSYTYTINGLTYKVSVDDRDNVIGIGVSGNGSGANSLFLLPSCDILNEPLILNGCNGGSNSTYFIQIYRPDGETTITQYGGNDVLYTPTVENQAYLCVMDGVYLNYSVWFYPMIRKANIKDNTFEPYKYSRGELNFNDYLDQVKVNMTTGVISCDTKSSKVGDKSWTYVGAPYYLFYCDIPKLALGEKIISSGFKQTHVSDPLLIQNGEVWNESSEFGQHNLVVKDLRYDNVSDFRIGNNDILFNVKLEDEYIMTYQKSPTKFRLIDGYNTIKTNGSKIWIKYLTGDINKNVSKMSYNTARIQPDYYHTYNSISHTFTTTKKTFNYYDIEHCLDMIEDTRQKLESAIKDHSNVIVWTSIKKVDSTSGVAVSIPSSATWVRVILYAVNHNVTPNITTVCGYLEYPTAGNSNNDVELHGTVGSTDYYVIGETTGNKTWYVSANAYAQVYYHK